MSDSLGNVWWLVLIRGIAAILFGLAAFFIPSGTLVVLFGTLAVLLVVDGVAVVIWAFVRRKNDPRWWVALLQGLVALGLATLLITMPESFARTVLWMFGVVLLVAGALQIVQGIRLRREIEGEWLLILGGVLWCVLGVAFMAEPLWAGVAFVWTVGIWALVSGVTSLVLAFRIRSATKAGERAEAGGGPRAAV